MLFTRKVTWRWSRFSEPYIWSEQLSFFSLHCVAIFVCLFIYLKLLNPTGHILADRYSFSVNGVDWIHQVSSGPSRGTC